MIATFSVLVAALFAQAPTDVADERRAAKALEDRAFAMMDGAKFCEALALFLAADDKLPDPLFLYNAGRAAERAGDIPRAVEIYGRLLGIDVDQARVKDVRARITKLTVKLGQPDASRASCPATPPPNPTTATTTTTTATATTTTATATATATTATATTATPKEPVHPYATVGTISIVGGGVAVLAGAASIVGATMYWSAYDGARTKLVDDVGRQGTNAATLSEANDAESLRADYNAIGMPLYWVGGVAIGVGVVAAGAGFFAASVQE